MKLKNLIGDCPYLFPITDWSVTPAEKFVTANELDSRITNSKLELIGISCQLGKTKRIQEAINPGVFVGSRVNLRGQQGRELLDYATNRINGVDRTAAFQDLQGKGLHYVMYP